MSGLWICLVILHLIHHSHAVFWSQQFLQRAFTPAHYNFTESVKFAAPKCIEEYQNFVRGLFAAEPWAQRVLDSWSLTSSGLFSGNRFSYGHFDQCLESLFKGDESQYCLMNAWNPNIGQRLGNGVCLPKSCTTEAVHTILANLYPNLDLLVQEVYVCTTTVSDEKPIVSKGLNVFTVVLLLVMCSTAYHLYFGSKKKLLTSFSLIRNARSLLSTTKGGRIEVLDGLRVWGMLAVVCCHMLHQTVTTKSDIYTQFEHEWWYNIVYGSHLSVDLFFVIGGFVVTLKFIRIIDQKKPWRVLNFYINRYVRLTAPTGFLILFATAFYNTVQGPNTADVHYELRLCEEKWWMNLLHLQGYLAAPNLCMLQTWYLAVEAHLSLFAPVLFVCLKNYSTKFVVVLSTVIIMMSSVGTVVQRFYHFEDRSIFLTHTRLSPWFLGILLGFAVRQFQSMNRSLSLRQSYAVVIASSATMLGVFYTRPTENPTGAYNIIFDTTQHIFYGSAVALIIFALTNEPKDRSSFCTKILSHPNLHFFSKLSYSVYLLHLPVIHLLYAMNRSPMYLTKMTLFFQTIVVFWVTILASIPFTLMFEMPFVNLFNALFPE